MTLANPLAVARPHETIALALTALAKVVPGIDLKKVLVLDAKGSDRPVPAGRRRRRRVARRARLPDRLRPARDEGLQAGFRKARVAGPGRLQGLRALRSRAPRRLRLGERPRRAPDLWTGPGDLREGSAHLQRHRRLGQAGAEADRERVVHDRRLPSGSRRGRRLLFGRQVPRLRRRRDLDGGRARLLAELHQLARARQRPCPPRSSSSPMPRGTPAAGRSPRRSG